ncbi:AAA family ATPase [Pseudovibrio exalbescens]|uniref:AAA family ATPase n=1 Tax=Pseudovibrio exalbescens TaxID=197461 RepID=UPI002366949D|nr:AAA family ATPase [Pseudovibrio exalbescens]MDD7909287.1 AAA family ATPase [Pseudovibrio exalbescens]
MEQLVKFSLEKYKAYFKKAEFTIRPLTLFYGYNSSGKSAAIRFLQLLADTTDNGTVGPFNLRSEALRGATFSSLISKHSSSPNVRIGLGFRSCDFQFTIRNMPELQVQIVEQLSVQLSNGAKASFEWEDWNNDALQPTSFYTFSANSEKKRVEIRFEGLTPVEYPDKAEQYLSLLPSAMRNFAKQFYSLSPNCVLPERYELDKGLTRKISRNSDGLTSLLQAASQDVIEDISSWYQKATGYGFRRQKITIGDQSGYRFTLHPYNNDKLDIDIVDTGEGMGQVLPVVSLLKLAKAGFLGTAPTFAFEHPELHIHPDAHSHLANLFCETVTSNPKPRILVETHSENLLLGVQIAIAQGKMDPADVALHWIRGGENGAQPELIEFDKLARPIEDNWPIDIFRKNTELARKLFEERKGNPIAF